MSLFINSKIKMSYENKIQFPYLLFTLILGEIALLPQIIHMNPISIVIYIRRHGLYRNALWLLFVIFRLKTKQQIHEIIGVINNRCTRRPFSLE